MKRKYMAYGSNMDEEQMALRCPTARLLGKTELIGYALSFKGEVPKAFATIEKKKEESIPVLIWEIEPSDEKNLDEYEDYPVLYLKEVLSVDLNGERIEAMVYIMNEEMGYNLPQKEYYGIIEKAYEKFGFNQEILKSALNEAKSKSKP